MSRKIIWFCLFPKMLILANSLQSRTPCPGAKCWRSRRRPWRCGQSPPTTGCRDDPPSPWRRWPASRCSRPRRSSRGGARCKYTTGTMVFLSLCQSAVLGIPDISMRILWLMDPEPIPFFLRIQIKYFCSYFFLITCPDTLTSFVKILFFAKILC